MIRDPILADMERWPSLTRGHLISVAANIITELAVSRGELGMVLADEKRGWMQHFMDARANGGGVTESQRLADVGASTATASRMELQGRIAMLEEARDFIRLILAPAT